MSKNYFVKDPTFRSFIVGLIIFVVIIGVGVFGIKQLINSKKKVDNDSEITINDKKDTGNEISKTNEKEAVIETDVIESTAPEAEGSSEADVSPEQLAKVGMDFNWRLLATIIIANYVAIYGTQKFLTK